MKNFKNYISLISEETRIPEHLVERFLNGKEKLPQDFAKKISRCIKEKLDDNFSLDKNEYLRSTCADYGALEKYECECGDPWPIRDRSLEPLGICKGDIVYVIDADFFSNGELMCIDFYGATGVTCELTNNGDGTHTASFPNKEYGDIHIGFEAFTDIYDVLTKVVAYRHFADENDTVGTVIKL